MDTDFATFSLFLLITNVIVISIYTFVINFSQKLYYVFKNFKTIESERYLLQTHSKRQSWVYMACDVC